MWLHIEKENIGDSPSGKATDSDSVIRVFESLIPSQKYSTPSRCAVLLLATKRKNNRIKRVFARGDKQAGFEINAKLVLVDDALMAMPSI